MTEYLELFFRWAFGLQMIFWGLNGFFHLVPIPPSSDKINKFVEACIETKFLMPIVKIFEILFGICLIANFMVAVSLVTLAPILFVVTGLHVFHNPKPWGVLATCTVPYLILVLYHAPALLRLVH